MIKASIHTNSPIKTFRERINTMLVLFLKSSPGTIKQSPKIPIAMLAVPVRI